MLWIVIDDETGALISGPAEERPADMQEGQTALGDMPPNFGTEWEWDAASRGRRDLTPDMTLADARAHYTSLAEAARDARVNGGCDTPVGRVDTDRDSRLNIAGSLQMAGLMGSAFTLEWRLADNSYITLDGPMMTTVGLTVGQFVGACYGASFVVKDAITAATSLSELEAIDLQAGYPD